MNLIDQHAAVLPADAANATLVGRVHDDAIGGPCIVTLRSGAVVDITDAFPTMTDLSAAN